MDWIDRGVRIHTTRPIVVIQRENLLDPDVVKQYKLPESTYYVNALARTGNTTLLDKWASRAKNADITGFYDGYALQYASIRGHVGVLDWFKAHGLKQKTVTAMTNGVKFGNKADAWWAKSGFVVKWKCD